MNIESIYDNNIAIAIHYNEEDKRLKPEEILELIMQKVKQ